MSLLFVLAILATSLWKVQAFSEECAHIQNFKPTRPTGHAIVCSKLYHGIWAMPMTNPVTIASESAPCSPACYSYDQCQLAETCLDGTDGICVFNTNQLKSGLKGNACPGNSFAIYYICLPLKEHVKDACYGLPGNFCFEETFKSGAPVRFWTRGDQLKGGAITQDHRNPVYKDQLYFKTLHTKASLSTPPKSTVMIVTDPNSKDWENYEMFANFRINHPDFTIFKAKTTQMVGIIFRHTGNTVSGKHYMAGWIGTGGKISKLGLYEFNMEKDLNRRLTYKMVKNANTAPLPANKWFAMRVVLNGENVKVYTNKSPLGDPESQCSMIDGTDIDPINCNGNMLVLEHNFNPNSVNYNAKGTVGLYFAGVEGYSDDLTVRKVPKEGFCGNGKCEPKLGDEDCINCPQDCDAPCGCGDGICAGDHEALGCREDCFKCKVMYQNKVTKEWFSRGDNVAVYYSFDDPTDLGHDDSLNGVNMYATLEDHRVSGCAPDSTGQRQKFKVQQPGCIRTEALSFMFLQKQQYAYGKLPVGSCDMTIAAFVTVTEGTIPSEPSSLVRWGSVDKNRQGLSNNIRMERDAITGRGTITWFFGLHTHTVNVDWTKPGLRHLAFTYSSKFVETRIYIDGRQIGSEKKPCSNTAAPQMVTFGRMQLGNYNGILDDFKIMSVAWSALQVDADFKGSAPYVKPPASINAAVADIVYPTPVPTPMPGAPTPVPTTTGTTTEVEETLGPRWFQNAPTPKPRLCRDYCVDYCAREGAQFVSCLCEHEYSIPDPLKHVQCPASLLHLSLLSSLISMMFMMF